MKLQIEIPTKAQILSGGFPVKVFAKGEKSGKPDLGDFAERRGVYIFHADGKLLYVGKTTEGDYGIFRERLYRHLSETPAVNSPTHQLLRKYKDKKLMVYLLDLDDLGMMLDAGSMKVEDVSKALIMEQVLIGVFRPEGNKAGKVA